MPTPSLSDKERLRRKSAIEAALRDGFTPQNQFGGKGSSIPEAARRLGIKRGAVESFVKSEESLLSIGKPNFYPDWSLFQEDDTQAAQIDYTPDIDGIEEAKPRVRVRAYNLSVTKDLPVRRMVAIGDLHLKPGMDFQHMRWIGRYVAETRPDNVLQIGDCFDMESCEMHSAAGSASQMHRPSFIEDIEAGQEAFDLYHAEVGIGEIPHDEIYGNHEYRVNRLEELAPNLAGTLTMQVDQFFARYRWRTTPYRHWLFFEGVGFTHVPINIMQKPIGGRYPENTIGNQATHSIVFGHTHRNNNVTVPKIGINNAITITNLGSAMPHGYTPKYTDGATTGLTYGIHELRLRGGRVESDKFISMLELAERYG